MIEFTITEQVIDFILGEEVTFEIVESEGPTITFEQVGPQGPQGQRGPVGPAGPVANLDDLDLPDFTLIFENQLV